MWYTEMVSCMWHPIKKRSDTLCSEKVSCELWYCAWDQVLHFSGNNKYVHIQDYIRTGISFNIYTILITHNWANSDVSPACGILFNRVGAGVQEDGIYNSILISLQSDSITGHFWQSHICNIFCATVTLYISKLHMCSKLVCRFPS